MTYDLKIEQFLSCEPNNLSDVELINFYLTLTKFLQDQDRMYYDDNSPKIDDTNY